MKKLTAVLLAVVMIFMFTLTACSPKTPDNTEGSSVPPNGATDTSQTTDTKLEGTISVMVTYTDAKLDTFRTLTDAFTKETGVKIDLLTPGAEVENQLKVMMASNDLPDVWNTHGWSYLRYGDYLKTVNNQPWFDTMDKEALAGVMADKDGNFYALGVSSNVSGLVYNKDVLDKVGVKLEDLGTWDNFEDACDKIVDAGLVPIAVGGSMSGNLAGIFGSIAPTYWTDKGAKYDLAASLKDGTFDWDRYGTELFEIIADYADSGYFNEDILTLDSAGAVKLLGSGKAAFMVRGIDNITVARGYYPDANLGILPMPASNDTSAPSFRIGENDAFGVWKDTKNEDACWAFLAFLARPENAAKICEATGGVPAIKGTKLSNTYTYDAYISAVEWCGSNVQYDNVFDRSYFPSGMWSPMGQSVSMILDDTDDVSPAVEFIKDTYTGLMEEAK